MLGDFQCHERDRERQRETERETERERERERARDSVEAALMAATTFRAIQTESFDQIHTNSTKH